MPAREADDADRPPLALILVRNSVTHDNRVRREIDTLRRAGFGVMVAGVVSTEVTARRAQVTGAELLRLDPRSGLGRRMRRPASGRGRAVPDARAGRASTAAQDPGAAARLRRLAVTASYYLRGAALCWRARPVLVHANDYNTMWIALAAKLLCGSRVVYDSHELWPDRNRRPEWRPWLLACEWLFLRVADATITASPGYADEIARRYRVPGPTVIRNIPAEVPGPPAFDSESEPDRPLAVYVGGLMPGRGLEPAIEALALVPGLRMRFVGPGADSYRASLAAFAERLGAADRLELRPAVAPAQVLAAIDGASVGLMLIQPVCRSYELTLPNKLFEYAAAGVPILSSDLAVIGRVVRDHELGEAVPPGDVERLAAAMGRLIEPGHNRQLRSRVHAFARENTWEQERAVLTAVYTAAMKPR